MTFSLHDFLIEENEHFILFYKPPHIALQGNDDVPGFLEKIRQLLEKERQEDTPRLHLVHRLDKITSGLLILAKGKENAHFLSEAFADRKVQKCYLGLSVKKPNKKQGKVVGDQTRSRRGSWKLTRTKENPARTQFISTSLTEQRTGLRLYLMQPHTGKTHQLRVMMKSLGSSVLGDSMYGQAELAKREDRAYLHAYALRFELLGKQYSFVEAPREGKEFLGQLFQKTLESYTDPFSAFPVPKTRNR